MDTHYVDSWNYELLMLTAYPDSLCGGEYKNCFMQFLLIYEDYRDDQDILTKSEYLKGFRNVKANVIKGLNVLSKKGGNLNAFIDAAVACTNAHDLNHACKEVLELLRLH